MSCKEIQRKFSQFFDDVLSGKKNKVLFDHLSKCKTCRKAWDQFNSIFNSLRCLPREEPPFDITSSVMARIQEMEERKCWWRRLLEFEGLKPLVGALAVVLLVLATVTIYQKSNKPGPVMEMANSPRGIDVSSQAETRVMRRTALPPGRFAATISPFSARRYTVVTIYVDDIDQAERKISTLASRVSPYKDRTFSSNRYPQKILTQFRINIPATELDSLLKELTKIGQVTHKRVNRNTTMGKIQNVPEAEEPELGVAKTSPSEAIYDEIHGKRKMGQGHHPNVPLVPVNVVVVSKGGQ